MNRFHRCSLKPICHEQKCRDQVLFYRRAPSVIIFVESISILQTQMCRPYWKPWFKGSFSLQITIACFWIQFSVDTWYGDGKLPKFLGCICDILVNHIVSWFSFAGLSTALNKHVALLFICQQVGHFCTVGQTYFLLADTNARDIAMYIRQTLMLVKKRLKMNQRNILD